MDRDAAINIIRRHEPELRRLGVVSLSLFGSTARNTATKVSDIDVAVRLKDPPRGFAYIGHLDAIEARLSQVLGRPVDLVPEPAPAPRIQQAIELDRCHAF